MNVLYQCGRTSPDPCPLMVKRSAQLKLSFAQMGVGDGKCQCVNGDPNHPECWCAWCARTLPRP